MNDYRENYFNPPHEDSPDKYEIGGDRYDPDLDRVTEQEMVPDIVERLTTRYNIGYNLNNQKRREFRIPGLNNIRIIRLLKQLFALLPRNMENGQINNTDVVVIPIINNDTNVSFNINNSQVTILRAYLSSSMIDISNCLNYESGTYKFTPTIPFKQNDELIVYYK